MSIFRTLVARVKSPFTIAGLALPKLALRFVDGNDYIYVPPSDSLVSTNAVSVCALVKFADKPRALLRKHYQVYWFNFWYHKECTDLYESPRGLSAVFWNVDTAGGLHMACRNNKIEPGYWYYICGIYPGCAYVNGIDTRYGFTFARDGRIIDQRSPIIIGSEDEYFHFYGRIFNGYLTHVHIYPDKALTVDEINKNMKTPDDPVRDGLKLYYSVKLRNIRDVDHDGVPEILDLSGYNNHGKIYGAKLQLTF
jgi:hypothetical protein